MYINIDKSTTAKQILPWLKKNNMVIKECRHKILDKIGGQWVCKCGATFLDKELPI